MYVDEDSQLEVVHVAHSELKTVVINVLKCIAIGTNYILGFFFFLILLFYYVLDKNVKI